jgi:hypothetical protein
LLMGLQRTSRAFIYTLVRLMTRALKEFTPVIPFSPVLRPLLISPSPI